MLYKLAATALCLQGALAGPNNHRRHGHARREAMQYDNPNWTATVDWNAVCANGACAPGASAAATSAPNVPAPVVKAEAQVTSAVSQASSAVSQASSAAAQYGAPSSSAAVSSVSSGGSVKPGDSSKTGGFAQPWTGSSSGGVIPGPASAPWLSVAEFGSPPGANIIQVQDSPSNYQYTTTFSNSMSSPRTVWIWNKSGISQATGQRDGMVGQSQPAPVKFTLPAGGNATYAFMPGTSGAACDITDSNPQLTSASSPNCAFVEWTFTSSGSSSYDVSKISTNNFAGHGACNVAVSGPSGTSTCANTPYQGPGDEGKGIPFNPTSAQVNLVATFGGN